jgi:hypothetical protein
VKLTLKDIDALDLTEGHRLIRFYHEERMRDEINLFASHGFDVTDERVMGTTLYRDFLREQRNLHRTEERCATLHPGEAHEVNTFFNEEIQKVITLRKRLEAPNG